MSSSYAALHFCLSQKTLVSYKKADYSNGGCSALQSLLRPFSFQRAETETTFPHPLQHTIQSIIFLKLHLKKKSFSQAIEKATNSSLCMSSPQATHSPAHPSPTCSCTLCINALPWLWLCPAEQPQARTHC